MFEDFRKLGFFKTFVIPACVLFLIPAISLAFMTWGQRKYDGIVLRGIVRSIQADSSGTPDEKAVAIAFFKANPVSKLRHSQDPDALQFVSRLPDTLKNYYLSFDVFIGVAWFCILAGAGLIAFVVFSVPLSMRSQRLQYLALATGWYSIRFFMTLQVIAQGILVVGLSYWVTALLFGFFSVKLIGIFVLMAGGAMLAVLGSIFVRIPTKFELAGKVLQNEEHPEFWNAIAESCRKIGTKPPDQIVVGIDDRFFVTEMPVHIDGKRYDGKTLYLSLSMLKTFSEDEAEAVLMHELAHFSGNDTYFSRKISPLLNKFHFYLATLYELGIAYPIFLCTLMFRNLYEISLGKLSRQREFRADRIAAELVGGDALARALVRIVAYSSYRGEVESGLLNSAKVDEEIGVKRRLEDGFLNFAPKFAESGLIGQIQSSHPFDSHPPIDQRFAALKSTHSPESIRSLLAAPGDGKWHTRIRDVDRIESELWANYEKGFREYHEQVLAHRYLPETDEEAAVVAKYYPRQELPSSVGKQFVIDHEQIQFDAWSRPIPIRNIAQLATKKEWGKPLVVFQDASGMTIQEMPLPADTNYQQLVLQTIQRYVMRSHYAVAYQRELQKTEKPGESNQPGPGESA